jgi:hypothetical protein
MVHPVYVAINFHYLKIYQNELLGTPHRFPPLHSQNTESFHEVVLVLVESVALV